MNGINICKIIVPGKCIKTGMIVNCSVYIGEPKPNINPIKFQMDWYLEKKSINLARLTQIIAECHKISHKIKQPFYKIYKQRLDVTNNSKELIR